MRRLVQGNPALAIGVALPIVVVVVFVLVSAVPRWLTAPPAHDLLLAYDDPLQSRRRAVGVVVDVVDGRLRARIAERDELRLEGIPRLFRYDAASGRVEEIEIRVPADAADLPDGTELPVPDLAGTELSTLLTAPDDYVFRGQRGRSGSVFGGLFGVGGARADVLIEKDGAVVRVPVPTASAYPGQVRFLGWAVEP